MPSAPINIETFLANVPLFKELDPREIERIAKNTRQIRAGRGEILFHRGDAANGFYVVLYGQVKLAFVAANGDEKVVEIIGAGQTFAEAVMFMGKPFPVTAQVLADSLLLYVAREAVFEELRRDPDFAARIIAGLSRRLHQLIGDLESNSMRSGTERVIGYLLREEPETAAADAPLAVTLPTTKGVIASRLNLTQEHFSRILHDLAAAGLIKVQGRIVHIHDVERLRTHQA